MSCFDDDDTAEITAGLANLTIHVLPVSEEFIIWRSSVLDRLNRFYMKQNSDPVGPVVPREILDLNVEFAPSMSNSFIEHFLSKLDPAKNSWLNNVEDMEKLKFSALPYRWDPDLDQDRFL